MPCSGSLYGVGLHIRNALFQLFYVFEGQDIVRRRKVREIGDLGPQNGFQSPGVGSAVGPPSFHLPLQRFAERIVFF